MNAGQRKAELYLPLTRNQVTVIDFDDRHIVGGKKYYANYNENTRSFYAKRNTTKEERAAGMPTKISLQREIMGFPEGRVVHHKNKDTLDNRRSNLDPTSIRKNAQARKGATRGSSSKYLGVSWNKERSKWMAKLRVSIAGDDKKTKNKTLGRFKDEREAAIARDEVAHSLNQTGDNDYTLNFPEKFQL